MKAEEKAEVPEPFREGWKPIMPMDSPLYGKLPWELRGVEGILLFAELDEDYYDLAEEMVPTDLELTGRCGYYFGSYERTGLGVYGEVIATIEVEGGPLDGPGAYCPCIYVDSVIPHTGGREALGAPKKIANIELRKDRNMITATMERPDGVNLVTCIGRLETEIGPEAIVGGMEQFGEEEAAEYGVVSLRVIPNMDATEPESVRLVKWGIDFKESPEAEVWTGEFSIDFPVKSDLDPLYKIRPKNILFGSYSVNVKASFLPAELIKEYK